MVLLSLLCCRGDAVMVMLSWLWCKGQAVMVMLSWFVDSCPEPGEEESMFMEIEKHGGNFRWRFIFIIFIFISLLFTIFIVQYVWKSAYVNI